MKKHHLFPEPEECFAEERIDLLAAGSGNVRIERIVSRGHASPAGFWYDQDTIEWVALLKGSATLRFENEPEPMELQPGDWIEIPAHCRHRVEATSAKVTTVWLAIHWDKSES